MMFDNSIKLLVFDLDGTIIDSADANYYAYSSALKSFGYELPRDFFDENCFNGQHYTQFLPQIMRGVSADEIKSVHRKKQEIYKDSLHLIRINPFIYQLISDYRNKFLLSLVTSAAKIAVGNVLAKICLNDAFDFILTGDDVAQRKPKNCYHNII